MNELSSVQKAIILSMAKNDMKIGRVAEELRYNWNNVKYHCLQIRKKTGLNPSRFYDLRKLVEMLEGGTDNGN